MLRPCHTAPTVIWFVFRFPNSSPQTSSTIFPPEWPVLLNSCALRASGNGSTVSTFTLTVPFTTRPPMAANGSPFPFWRTKNPRAPCATPPAAAGRTHSQKQLHGYCLLEPEELGGTGVAENK